MPLAKGTRKTKRDNVETPTLQAVLNELVETQAHHAEVIRQLEKKISGRDTQMAVLNDNLHDYASAIHDKDEEIRQLKHRLAVYEKDRPTALELIGAKNSLGQHSHRNVSQWIHNILESIRG